MHGLLNEKLDATVFDIVRKNFDNVGYSVEFDEIYDEAVSIENIFLSRGVSIVQK